MIALMCHSRRSLHNLFWNIIFFLVLQVPIMCVIAKSMKIGLLSIRIHRWEDDFKTIVFKNGMDCTTPDDKGKCMENKEDSFLIT